MWLTVALTTLTAAEPTPGYLNHRAGFVLASADLAHVAAKDRKYVRYLWAGNLGAGSLPPALRVLDGHCNGMSRESDLTKLVRINGGALLRLDLRDYHWDPDVWELFLTAPEPYFSQAIDEVSEGEKEWAGGKDADGREFPKGFKYRGEIRHRVYDVSPFLKDTPEGKAAADFLCKETCSKVPVVSAAFFIWKTFVCVNGSPNYQDFLGVKKEADFDRIIGVERRRDLAFVKQLLESVAESGVTYEPRALERLEKIGGAKWYSYDFNEALDQNNPLEILGTDRHGDPVFTFDASEQYGHLPNGLWAVGLFNAKGEAVKNAPGDTITSGDTTTTNRRDHRVHLPLSCIRCHKDGGLRDIKPWVRNLLTPPPGLALDDKDYRRAKDLRQQYLRKLEPFMAADRQRYAAALWEATGFTPEQYAEEFGALWSRVAEVSVDLEYMARDMGVTEAALRAALDAQVKGRVGRVVLSAFLRPARQTHAIQVRQYYEQIPLLQLVLRGAVPQDPDVKIRPIYRGG